MNVREITEKSEYLSGLTYENVSFLQSYEYGQMHLTLGNTPLYLGLYDGEKLVKSCLFIRFGAKRGTFLFAPYIQSTETELEALLPFVKKYASEHGVDFIRLAPLMDDTQENRKLFERYGARSAPVHMMHPELLWLLDISGTEDEILAQMRKNTRYYVRRGERDGVSVVSGTTQELLNQFYAIHSETSKRQKFTPYPKSYLDTQLKYFSAIDSIRVFIAYFEGKPIAGAVIMYYGEEGSYHHGASLSEYNKLPGSHMIQWEAIKEAKSRGMKRYNFWGVVENAPRHPWAGLSFFKQGFGGSGRTILHCLDIPLTKKYILNYLIERIRRWYRGY